MLEQPIPKSSKTLRASLLKLIAIPFKTVSGVETQVMRATPGPQRGAVPAVGSWLGLGPGAGGGLGWADSWLGLSVA